MSDNTNENTQPELKKISLAEAIKNKLAQKKADQISQSKNPKGTNTNGLVVKSQNHKKANNQRRRTGGS